jgi:diguanylate cyclase (GGDEF)-like protein/PAS domain S-box-containing protein
MAEELTEMRNFAAIKSVLSNLPSRVLLLFLPVALLIGASAYFVYQAELRRLHTENAAIAKDRLLVGVASIERNLQTATRDLDYLANRRTNLQLIDNPNKLNLSNMASDWAAFLQAKENYDQIRWIDEKGMERLRVNYATPNPMVVPTAKLQNKRGRYFFDDINRLKQGEVFISPLDLNVEDDHIEIPFKPTIRFGAPMFDSKGTRRGIFLINYSAASLLERFSYFKGIKEKPAWLVNQSGYWLISLKADDEFGFMFNRTDLTMKNRYPGAWKQMLAEQEGQFETEEGLWTFDTVYPQQAAQTGRSVLVSLPGSESNGDKRFWKAIYLLPSDEYNAGIPLFAAMLGGAAILLLILFYMGIWRLVRFQGNVRRRLEKTVEERTRGIQGANEQLSMQQLRLSSLIQTMPDLVWLKDLNGAYLLCNHSFERFFGARESDIVGKTDKDFISAGLADSFHAGDRAAIEAGTPYTSEEWVTFSADKHRALLETTRAPVITSGGKLIGVLGIGREITEQRQMENTLREKEQLLALFVENAPAAIAMFDKEMRYLAVSRRFMEDYMLTESSLIGRCHYEIFPEISDEWRQFHKRGLQGETIRVEEERLVRSDGKIDWMRWEIKPWFAGGEVGGIILFTEVITERKEAEARERRLMNIYRALSATNEAIIHEQSEAALFPLVCNIAVEYGGMVLAWVGVANADGSRLVPAASSGSSRMYLDEIVVFTTADEPRGLRPAGVAYRERHSVVVNDFNSGEAVLPWREEAKNHGIKAMASFPVLRNGNSYAVFTVYSDQANAFDDEIVHLLDEMAANISFARDNLDREALRRQAENALKESEARMQRITNEAPFPMMIHAEDGEILQNNRSLSKITGYSPSEIPTVAIWAQKAFRERAAQAQAEIRLFYDIREQTDNGEYTVYCKDGTSRIWHFFSSPIGRLPDGRRAVISMAVDITERKEAEESLKLAAMVYQDSSEAMMIADADNKIIAVNPAFERITGYSAEEATSRHTDILMPNLQGDDVYQAIKQTLDVSGYWKGELWSRRRNGEAYAALITINTTFNPDGSVHRRVVLFSDITKKKESEDLIWNQANFDALTKLPNRNMFRDHLKQAIKKAHRANMPMALMFLDMDGFKYVNDTLGHDKGDILLQEAAQRLNSCMRDSDTVARLGGDEFTVILSDLHDVGNVDRVALHILQRMSEPFQLGEEVVHVSVSIGITLYPNDATEIDNLFRNADQAMYAAKHEGRNRYRYFTESMQEAAQTRMRLVNDLRGALEGNQFEVVYQPIIDLSNEEIHKAEALIRWRHPTRGLINPIEFISAAEDTGMIVAFGNWIFHQAASQAAKWRTARHPQFQVSVNISPVQFQNGNISLSTWFEHLQKVGLPGQGIVVEITEGLLLDASTKVKNQLLAFRDGGIEVALDDFGVGYSSLSYLKKFDIDYLKIDQIFVRNLTKESDDLALCEAIIVMAHKLGIKVIAEGVEKIEQRDLLTNAGCDYAQGYLFSGPLSAEELGKRLLM